MLSQSLWHAVLEDFSRSHMALSVPNWYGAESFFCYQAGACTNCCALRGGECVCVCMGGGGGGGGGGGDHLALTTSVLPSSPKPFLSPVLASKPRTKREERYCSAAISTCTPFAHWGHEIIISF